MCVYKIVWMRGAAILRVAGRQILLAIQDICLSCLGSLCQRQRLQRARSSHTKAQKCLSSLINIAQRFLLISLMFMHVCRYKQGMSIKPLKKKRWPSTTLPASSLDIQMWSASFKPARHKSGKKACKHSYLLPDTGVHPQLH